MLVAPAVGAFLKPTTLATRAVRHCMAALRTSHWGAPMARMAACMPSAAGQELRLTTLVRPEGCCVG